MGGDGFEVGVHFVGFAGRIVGDDQAAGADQGEELIQVVDEAFLFGVEEHYVDRAGQPLDRFMGVAP